MLGVIIPIGVPSAPGAPDQSLPGGPGQPGVPGQGLPGGSGGRPDQSLPGSQPGADNTLPGGGARPDQGLPGGEDAWVLAYSPRSGYHWMKFSGGHVSGQPVPPTAQPTAKK
jgi:hypothetical protein